MGAPDPILVREPQKIGRFQLLRRLGAGAQGIVFLAQDPTLERRVAVKTLKPAQDDGATGLLLREARTASTLTHPNIVPVYEVGIERNVPYVVFEFVEGRTLKALLREEGAMPLARAVVVMSQILAGAAHVHGHGLMHGDLTPSNVLISRSGMPRITDFGISRPLNLVADGPVASGTIHFMAPECFTDGTMDLRSEVFALGLMFHEMLTGEPVFGGINDFATIYRIVNEQVPAPSTRNPRVPPEIDRLVQQAVSRDAGARFPDAGAMKEVLDRYRVAPADQPLVEIREQTIHGTVEFLLRRMRVKGEFPALSSRFAEINRLTSDDADASAQRLGSIVLQDFSLTNRLLRIANSAGGGGAKIANVTQAISVLGMKQVRATAVGLMLTSVAGAQGGKGTISEALTGAFVAGAIARNVGRLARVAEVEELFICGMFSRLGEMLTLHYFADEYAEIQRLCHEEAQDEASAVRSVLGLGYDELGVAVARHWNFPERVLGAMRPLPPGVLPPPRDADERMLHCAGYARELCLAARTSGGAGHEAAYLRQLGRFAGSVGPDANVLVSLIDQSLELALKYAGIAGASTAESGLIIGLTAWANIARASLAPPSEPPAPAEPAILVAASNDEINSDTAPAPRQEPQTRAEPGGIGARALGFLRRIF